MSGLVWYFTGAVSKMANKKPGSVKLEPGKCFENIVGYISVQ